MTEILQVLPTSSLLVPTYSPSPSVGPLPTVVPSPVQRQEPHDLGRVTLWVVFALMLISTVVFAALAYRVPVQKRLFHVLTTFIVAIATISYFSMANGDAKSWHFILHKQDHKHGIPPTWVDVYRLVFWGRYVDWALTTPLLLLDLGFLAGLNGANIIVAVVADIVMVLTGLFAAFGHGQHKWGYFTFAIIAYLVVIYQLAYNGRKKAIAKDTRVGNFYTAIAGFSLILWTIYPIIWGLGEGSHRLSVDHEILAYAILDFLAKPVFGIWLLLGHARIASTNIALDGFWTNGLGASEGLLRLGDDDEGA
ncbi:family A G protein-coupled receptor-like protein [Xylona heveae TC161]|uniref:Family A G protein-coupled receptor-like protein n=1 Tax=Xylona heveae (strain CBS 132557 / TC161) TaxID=1328760 RepID=A0A165I1G2_XYLHT|nr:family A G protein-coupled receptor-like protein [Xylona heveae TC161]KZF24222.1 family A G protein-coupled receptor-like protein [Xylona heveae TC161]